MENKRSGMERVGMVEITKISDEGYSVKENENDLQSYKFKTMVEQYGQFNTVKICKNNGTFKIIDGLKLFKILKELKYEKVNCFYIGKCDDLELASMRIFFNYNYERKDYIGISKTISSCLENENDIKNFSIKTCLTIDEVKRFKGLVNFDWKEFMREDPNKGSQIDMFNI
jgi:hypothetical protein